jgi:hypothetical protein
MYLTQYDYESIKPAIVYSSKYVEKISKLRQTYIKAKNRVEELFKISYDGHMNLSTKPFEFFYNTKEPGETHHFKIDGHILEKTKRPTCSYRYRYSSIYESSFLKHFVPNWKDEYLPNIRFQYRDIFSKVIKFAKTYNEFPEIKIEKSYEVEPRTFIEYPDTEIKYDKKLILQFDEGVGLKIDNNANKYSYYNMESANYYPIIYSYKNEFDDFYLIIKKVYDEKIKIVEQQKKELEEIYTPFLIAKALFLESNEQTSSR